MKKRNLILVAVLAIAATATGASAENANTGFDPLLDADYLEVWMDGTAGGQNHVPALDADLDADIIEFTWVGLAETGRNVEIAFDPILDADIDMGFGDSGVCKTKAAVAVR